MAMRWVLAPRAMKTRSIVAWTKAGVSVRHSDTRPRPPDAQQLIWEAPGGCWLATGRRGFTAMGR